ncbi:single-strand binding protein [Stanieria cyanosphaera PCC 7437]|uniref:Single-stranded DNA-binding protein n=1 Tax=Stanieria cyanosphaera (strain ATCC 29371 / PCC 7437) TaxID=111780 RepID=K9XY78_STAC7|nr:single-stranded DNA-binding protein [Stanieria cyanosphaera]AFZ37019.1 single-strand binding protein [Stanieria cyanosphaera PCC 7437]
MGLNLVNLVGHAGADPEIRYFPEGGALCKLPLAVNRRSRNNETPDWFNLEIWGKTAEIAYNYVRKGKLIGIQGTLKIDTWSDRNTGATRSRPVIRVTNLELLGSKRDTDPSAVGSYSNDSEI